MKKSLKNEKGKMFLASIFFLGIIPSVIFAKETIIINEIFPNPQGSDKGKEFVELYNANKENINMDGWVLKKTSKKGSVKKIVFDQNTEIKKSEYFEIKFSGLNNDGATIELILNDVVIDSRQYKNVIEGESYNRDENDESKNWYWEKETAGEKNTENPVDKKYPKIIINEVLPNPSGEEKKKEFIELYNPNNKDIELKNWQIKDGSKTGKYVFKDSDKIKAGKYFIVYRSDFKFALNNSGTEQVKIIAPNKKIIDKMEYKSAKEDVSYNYSLKNKNWRWSKKLTPGAKNLFNNLPTFELKKGKKVYKNMYTYFKVDKLRDRDDDEVKVFWDFGDGHKSYLESTKHKYKKTGKYKVKLVVSDGNENVIKEFKIQVKKYPKYELKIVGIMPNPNGKDKGREIILIKNLDKKRINLKGYKIGTGKNEDKVIGHPVYDDLKIKAGKIKKITNKNVCKFNLLNKGGVVQLLYPNGKVADEVRYMKDKIFPDEMYVLNEKTGQWYWRGVANIKERSRYNENEKIEVLGVKVVEDITIDNDLKVCRTIKKLKMDKWASSWVNRWLLK